VMAVVFMYEKVSLEHGYDTTEVCFLLNIFCPVVTKLQTNNHMFCFLSSVCVVCLTFFHALH